MTYLAKLINKILNRIAHVNELGDREVVGEICADDMAVILKYTQALIYICDELEQRAANKGSQ